MSTKSKPPGESVMITIRLPVEVVEKLNQVRGLSARRWRMYQRALRSAASLIDKPKA